MGAINCLGLAKRLGARILQASTSEVYGDPEVHPQSEDYWGNVNPIGPRACYDEGKRCAESLFFDYHRQNKVNTRVIRIFNTYGPRMRIYDGRAIPTFIAQALRKEDVTIFGKGTQTRSFCYVTDLVDGILRLIESDIHQPVNIGNPTEMSIEEMARMIIDMTNSSSQIVFQPLPEDDPKIRKPDIARAQTKLGWTPKVSIEDGLTETIKFFKKELSS